MKIITTKEATKFWLQVLRNEPPGSQPTFEQRIAAMERLLKRSKR